MLCLIGTAFVSCVGTAPTKEVHLIDSLNQAAYAYRYKNLDSSCHAASKAYRGVKLYRQGKAEACNNLGFCAFMRMDFEQAEKYYQEVYSLTKNELELLIADIGLMKIYQRTALNKEFYDYRNSAVRRMKRIAEDNNLFVDRHERMRLTYARSEFILCLPYITIICSNGRKLWHLSMRCRRMRSWQQTQISYCIITI